MSDLKMAAMALFLVFPMGSQAQTSYSSSDSTGSSNMTTSLQQATREHLVAELLNKWTPFVEEMYHVKSSDWMKEFQQTLDRANDAQLERALGMETYGGMTAALQGKIDSNAAIFERAATRLTAATLQEKDIAALGETSTDLVYVPLAKACRIADTRLAGGALAVGSTRAFDVTTVANYAFQGGEATNCDGLGAAGSFAAVAVQVTTPAPAASGALTLFAFSAAQPSAESIQFSAGVNSSNAFMARLDQGASANELSIFTSATTHVVLDALGYFINPEATQLDCIEKTSSNITVNANSTGTGSSPACDAGYAITGGGCSMSTFDGRVVTSRQFLATKTHFCAFRNENASIGNIGVAYGTCCRTPGR